jgi:hypothetical protein
MSTRVPHLGDRVTYTRDGATFTGAIISIDPNGNEPYVMILWPDMSNNDNLNPQLKDRFQPANRSQITWDAGRNIYDISFQ